MTSSLFNKNNLNAFTITLFLLFTIFIITGTYRIGHASDFSLNYTSDKLSADISRVSLGEVLEELSAQSGIRVFLDESIKSKKVSAQFENLPLEKGIKKLVQPYSSAMIFGKWTTQAGRDEFYISQLKVFDSTKEGASYMLVGETMQGRKNKGSLPMEEDQKVVKPKRVVHVPLQIRDPAKAAAFHKKVSASMLRTRVGQRQAELHQHQKKMRYEEEQKRHQLQQLRQELNTASENEVRKIQANMSLLTADLRNLQARNAQELKRLEREVDQLKHRILQQSGS